MNFRFVTFQFIVALTESETEYGVTVVKHVFADHVVLQFNLTNTLNDQKLENVRVVLEGGDQVWLLDRVKLRATVVFVFNFESGLRPDFGRLCQLLLLSYSLL